MGRLVGVASAVWLATALGVGAFLYDERHEALDRAGFDAEALVLAVDAHTARTYETVGIALADVADALRQAPDLPRNDAAFRQSLVGRLQALQPYARALFVVDTEGRIAHDTWFPYSPDVRLADREYFQAHQNDASLERAVWPPVRSRQPGLGWFLAVTHRLSRDGQFAGVAVASLEPQYFSALFGRLALDQADSISLYHRDGTLIAGYPYRTEEVGASFAAFRVFREHLPQARAGSYVTSSGIYAYERLVSYRALEHLPLVVAMRQSTWSILRPWREALLGAALGLGALALLLALLVRQLLRYQRMRELARERTLQSEKLEALGHLTDAVSHDFANLLNVVSASLRVITVDPADAGRVREAAAVGGRALARGAELVEQLSRFAQRQPLHLRAADLHAAIGAVLGMLRHACGEGMAVRTELAAPQARCMLDESELELALVNLAVNARDAGARELVLRTSCRDRFVCLEVADDGRGMSPEVSRRVFEPYFSTKGARGTGLGLAQVYGFMRQAGGEASVESQPGRGTTVCLRFAAAAAAAEPARASASSPSS